MSGIRVGWSVLRSRDDRVLDVLTSVDGLSFTTTMNNGSERNDNQDEEGKDKLEDNYAVGDAEIETVRQHLGVLDLRQQTTAGEAQFAPPEGMDAVRFHFVIIRMLQQSEGLLFASVNEAFAHEWVEFGKADFDALLRNKETHLSLLTDEKVKSIYQATWDAATNEKTHLSNSPNPMTWVHHSRLCEDVQLVAKAAHLCPKTGSEGKTDTWIYVAQAVLGLQVSDTPSDEDILVMRKALRGCYPPLPDAKPNGKRQKQDTIHNTGLNRSPCNLLSTMDQKYIFDSTACLYVLPVMDVLEAKAWDGGSYKVLILCDNDSQQGATHEEVAMGVGLSRTNAAAATSADVSKAIGLLSCVMKFSAYALEKMPAPPGQLWTKLKKELLQGRAMYASIKKFPVGLINGKIIVPTANDLGRKVIAKVDLDRSCRGLDNFAFPDPILLACKTSVNWSRKFGFRLIAESEQNHL